MSLPRTEEHLIRDYVKFRVGKIVYAAISPDETTLGFGVPERGTSAAHRQPAGPVPLAETIRPEISLDKRPHGRPGQGRDARTDHRRVAHGGAQAGRGGPPRHLAR